MVDAGILGAEEEEGTMSVSSERERVPSEVKQCGGDKVIMSSGEEVR